MRAKKVFLSVLLIFIMAAINTGCAKKKDIILATTTSTIDSGLLDELIPVFEKESGYKVKPVGVGSGQALAMGEKGEADVLLTHAPKSEKVLVDKGAVTDYSLVMHNDFIIVGPPGDPAKIKGVPKIADVLNKIATSKALFISRGDDSGTHKKELDLWKKASITPSGTWYQETGTGMGQTLSVASEKGGYTFTDRASFLALKGNLKLEVVLEGDVSLLNIYHVMAVNDIKFPKVNKEGASAFIKFMLHPETQRLIDGFGRDKYGEPLFTADAGKSVEELK